MDHNDLRTHDRRTAAARRTTVLRISTVDRPYTLTFRNGTAFPLTSIEAQRLIDRELPFGTVRSATRYRVVIDGYGSGTRDASADRSTLTPATIGGGIAFVVTR